MPDPKSPFYPPRAPWYAPARDAGHKAVAATRIQKIPTPGQMGLGRLLAALVLPGYAFVVHGRRSIGLTLMALWPVLVIAGLAFLGQVEGNLLLGLAISLHATSLVHLLSPWFAEERPGIRILTAIVSVLGMLVFVYLPLQEVTHRTLFTPIVTEQGSIVVRPTRNPTLVRRDTWIVYQTTSLRIANVIVRDGLAFAPVLALPGDTVEFTRAAIRVNGTDLPRQPDMPTVGSLVVPESHWFVWPRLHVAINTAGVGDEDLRGIILSQASVPMENLRGIPFTRWFHRQQLLATP